MRGISTAKRWTRIIVRIHYVRIATLLCGIGLLLPITVSADGYDFDSTYWQVDFREANAGVFYTYLAHANYLAPTGTFHYGWLGIFTAQGDGTVGSSRFTQIGIRSENGVAFWEFETEHTNVVCLRGNPVTFTGPLTGCRGTPNDLTNINYPNAVSIAHNDSYHVWYASVADSNGNSAVVATADDGTLDTYQPGGVIYQPMQEVLEHYWLSFYYPSDPYDGVSYYFYAPRYVSYIWPAYQNSAYDYQDDPGCLYDGIFNLNGDPTQFYLGTGGNECNHVFNY